MITDISNGNIEITEETPPEIKRTTYSKNQIVSKYGSYDILRYANSLSIPKTIDNSYKQPITVTANHKIYTYDEYGNQESGRWIDSGDSCYIEAVYTNGFVKVQYPTSSGKRWAYAKRDDFSIPKVDTKWYNRFNPVDIGNEWYGYIINTENWKHLTNDGNNVSFRTETGNFNQIWKFTKNNDGSYKIISLADGNVLDVTEESSANGTNVGVYRDKNNNAQKWFIYGSSGQQYLRAACTDCTLDLAGGKFYEGVNAQMWEKNDSTAQKFHLWKLDISTVDMGNEFDALILNKPYWKPLMMENSISEGSNVVLGTENQSNMSREVWHFRKNSDGSYRIMPLHNTNLSLDVDEKERRVLIWGNHDGANQKWFIYQTKDGCIIKPACSNNMVMDLCELTSKTSKT